MKKSTHSGVARRHIGGGLGEASAISSEVGLGFVAVQKMKIEKEDAETENCSSPLKMGGVDAELCWMID